MKKVWILEGFITPERIEESKEELRTLAKSIADDGNAEIAKQGLKKAEEFYAAHPDGYWLAYHGKTNYKSFCNDAKATMRNLRYRDMKWRVLKAEIEDDAETWLGYVNGVENEGVLRYLYATL